MTYISFFIVKKILKSLKLVSMIFWYFSLLKNKILKNLINVLNKVINYQLQFFTGNMPCYSAIHGTYINILYLYIYYPK